MELQVQVHVSWLFTLAAPLPQTRHRQFLPGWGAFQDPRQNILHASAIWASEINETSRSLSAHPVMPCRAPPANTSQIKPVCGTSVGRTRRRTCSKLVIPGERPPFFNTLRLRTRDLCTRRRLCDVVVLVTRFQQHCQFIQTVCPGFRSAQR